MSKYYSSIKHRHWRRRFYLGAPDKSLPASNVLLETGDNVLLESGDIILLEEN